MTWREAANAYINGNRKIYVGCDQSGNPLSREKDAFLAGAKWAVEDCRGKQFVCNKCGRRFVEPHGQRNHYYAGSLCAGTLVDVLKEEE